MCVVCIEFAKGKMTKDEADRALSELVFTDPKFDMEHLPEVEQLIDNGPDKP